MTILSLSFNDVNFSPVEYDNQIWLTASELANALGYARADSVSKIYERKADEFTKNMTQVIETTETVKLTVSNLKRKVRIFSLRGCHLIAIFARTAIAKKFREWVLDILDNEVGKPVIVNPQTTKIERAPLTGAVNLLVAKTKHLNYSEAYKLVHQRFNVEHIEDIPYDAIPVAVEYVHHLIALYSKVEEKSLFGNTEYELVRELAEAILMQNVMMSDIWRGLQLINKKTFAYHFGQAVKANKLAKDVGEVFKFKTKHNEPLVAIGGNRINFLCGVQIETTSELFGT